MDPSPSQTHIAEKRACTCSNEEMSDEIRSKASKMEEK